jgi:hypothetical protein
LESCEPAIFQARHYIVDCFVLDAYHQLGVIRAIATKENISKLQPCECNGRHTGGRQQGGIEVFRARAVIEKNGFSHI